MYVHSRVFKRGRLCVVSGFSVKPWCWYLHAMHRGAIVKFLLHSCFESQRLPYECAEEQVGGAGREDSLAGSKHFAVNEGSPLYHWHNTHTWHQQLRLQCTSRLAFCCCCELPLVSTSASIHLLLYQTAFRKLLSSVQLYVTLLNEQHARLCCSLWSSVVNMQPEERSTFF